MKTSEVTRVDVRKAAVNAMNESRSNERSLHITPGQRRTITNRSV